MKLMSALHCTLLSHNESDIFLYHYSVHPKITHCNISVYRRYRSMYFQLTAYEKTLMNWLNKLGRAGWEKPCAHDDRGPLVWFQTFQKRASNNVKDHCTKNLICTNFTSCKYGAKRCKLRLNQGQKWCIPHLLTNL